MSSIMLKYQEVNIFNDMTSIINISQNVTMSLHLKQLIYLFLEMLLYLTCICHSFNLLFLFLIFSSCLRQRTFFAYVQEFNFSLLQYSNSEINIHVCIYGKNVVKSAIDLSTCLRIICIKKNYFRLSLYDFIHTHTNRILYLEIKTLMNENRICLAMQ